MYSEYDNGYKVIIAGSSGVGKSSLLLRYVDNMYQTNLLSTIGVDFKFKALQVGDRKIRLQIWDTAGSQQFRSIVSAYYRGADAVILVYNLADKNTWNDLSTFWIQEVNKYKEDNSEVMVIGNKSDQQAQSIVPQVDLQQFMRKQNISLYHKTSAKTGDQVANAFEKLAKKLIQKDKGQKKANNQNGRVAMELQKNELSEQNRKKECPC